MQHEKPNALSHRIDTSSASVCIQYLVRVSKGPLHSTGMAASETLQGLPVLLEDIEAAAARLSGVAHMTPIVTSETFNGMSGLDVSFKCEIFQRGGSLGSIVLIM